MSRRYRAFFSYARADARVANWLYRALDGYRTPKSMTGVDSAFGPLPQKLHPIFRDKEDLSGGGALPERLNAALEDSDALIVLCTPHSATRRWVNEEVLAFQRLGRGNRIFPVLASSNPKRDAHRPSSDYLPPALRDSGLLAADLREIRHPNGQIVGDGRDLGRLKLIAGLLAVPLDALAQRERRRQRLLVMALSAAAVLFAGIAGIAGWQSVEAANNARIARANADAERRQRERADTKTLEAEASARAEREARVQEAIQRALADDNAERASNTLHRFFATRAWERVDSDDMLAAARYALAGVRLSTANARSYEAVLAGLMYRSGESLPPLVHDGPVETAAFSPDGRRIVTASHDGTAKIWDAGTGGLIATLDGRGGPVFTAWFSPDGQHVVTTGADGASRIWEAANGTLVRTLGEPGGLRGNCFDAAYSPNGRYIATLANERGSSWIKVWDASDGRLLASIPQISVCRFDGAVFSPDGERVVAPVSRPIVWNVQSGAEALQIPGTENTVRSAWFSPDGLTVLTADTNRTASLWDASDASLEVTVRDESQQEMFSPQARFSPDGRRIVTFSTLWDVSSRPARAITQLNTSPSMIAFSPDSRRVAVRHDPMLRILSTSDGQLIGALGGHEGTGRFSPDGRRIVIASRDGTATVWEATDAALNVVQWRERMGRRLPMAMDEDTGTPRFIVTRNGHNEALVAASQSADGRLLVGANGAVANVWDAATGRQTATLTGHANNIISVSFSPRGERIVTTSFDGTARVWRTRDGAPLVTLSGHARAGYTAAIYNAAFSNDGRRVVTAHGDGTAKVWDARDGRLLTTMRGHVDIVNSAAFSADDRRVVTASDDQRLMIWDAAEGTLIAMVNPRAGSLYNAVFSRDGRSVFFTNDRIRTDEMQLDVHRLTQSLAQLSRDACVRLLGPHARRFTQAEIDADPLLRAEWPERRRDVCEGVEGAPSIEDLRRRAGLLRDTSAVTVAP